MVFPMNSSEEGELIEVGAGKVFDNALGGCIKTGSQGF
jgi:hypothetical protein